MKWIHIYLLILGASFQGQCQFSSLLEELEMKNPVIIGHINKLKTKNMFDLTKDVMKQNQSICVTTNIQNASMQHSPGIILNKEISKILLQTNGNLRKSWIVIGKMPEMYSQIDKPLYFLENDTTLWEQFRFRSFKKRNRLGRILRNKFIWDTNKKRNLLERRGNLENMTLIGMMEPWETSTLLPKEWREMVTVSKVVKDSYEVS